MSPGTRKGLISIEWMAGGLGALYLLIGRWSPTRVSGASGDYFLEPRLWLVLALILLAEVNLGRWLALSGGRRTTRLGWPGSVPIAFLLYVLLTGAWAPEAGRALWKGYEIVLVAAATLALQSLTARAEGARICDAFWGGITAVTVLLALVALVSGLAANRVAVLGGGPNVFGRLMGLLVIGSVDRILTARGRPWSRWVWLPACVLGAALVVLSGSRGALIATAVALPFCFAVARAKAGRLVVTVAAVVAIAVVMVDYTDIGAAAQRVFGRRIVLLTIQEQHDSGRQALYSAAYAMGAEHPLLGGGLGSFPALVAAGEGQYPHNLFLEVFSECGGVGVLLLGLTLALYARGLWRARRHLDAASVSGFVLLLCASQFSGDLYDSRGLFLLPIFAVLGAGGSAGRSRTDLAQAARPTEVGGRHRTAVQGPGPRQALTHGASE